MAKTIFEHRLIAALVLCLSGLALLPFDILPTRVFGWEQLAGVYELIFEDDFEIGSVKRWPQAAPENLRLYPASAPASFRQEYRIDRDLFSRHRGSEVMLLSGFSAAGEPVFSVVARSSEESELEVRLGAALDDGTWLESDWQALALDSRFGIEWERGHALAEDGFLYLSIEDELRAWLTDLDNDAATLEVTALSQSGSRTFLIPSTSSN